MNMAESRELKDRIEALEARVAQLERPSPVMVDEAVFNRMMKGKTLGLKPGSVTKI